MSGPGNPDQSTVTSASTPAQLPCRRRGGQGNVGGHVNRSARALVAWTHHRATDQHASDLFDQLDQRS